MNARERGRKGGLALRAKVSRDYFAFIGRRGGLMAKAREWQEFANETTIESSKEWGERKAAEKRAAAYGAGTGQRVMLDLWAKCADEEAPRKRRRMNSDEIKMRRWARQVKEWR